MKKLTLTIWMAILAVTLVAVPAFAQAEQSSGTAQSTETHQTSGQDKDKTSQDKDKTGQDKDKTAQNKDKKDEKKDETKDDPENPKNDRLFLVVANYATVEHPKEITPLTAKQKFKIGAEDAFDTYSIPLAAVLAAIAQAKNDDPAWGQGWLPYGKRLAAGYGDTVIGSFMTTGVFPSLLREDPRYFRKGTGTKKSRSVYALKRIFVIRNDRGGSEFNFSEFGGNAAAAGISLTYHSSEERNFSSWGGDFLTQIAIDVIANQAKEFWPDIRHKLFKK